MNFYIYLIILVPTNPPAVPIPKYLNTVFLLLLEYDFNVLFLTLGITTNKQK